MMPARVNRKALVSTRRALAHARRHTHDEPRTSSQKYRVRLVLSRNASIRWKHQDHRQSRWYEEGP